MLNNSQNRRVGGLKDWKSWAVLAVTLSALVPYFSRPEALFWDDYTLFTGHSFFEETAQWGRPWVGPILALLSSLGPWSYKVVSFSSLVVGFFAVLKILSFHHSISPIARLISASVFVVAPAAFSRVTPAILTFQLSVVLFLIWWAWFLSFVSRRLGAGALTGILINLGLVLALASNGGLLPFVTVPILHGLLLWPKESGVRLTLVSYLRKIWWTIPLPFLTYWVTRSVFEPFGRFDGYNSIVILDGFGENEMRLLAIVFAACIGLLVIFIASGRGFKSSRPLVVLLEGVALSILAFVLWEIADFRDRSFRIWQVSDLDELANLAMPGIVWFFAANRISALWRFRCHSPIEDQSADRQALSALGIISLALSYVPYLAVGKPPHPAAFADRLEILVPIALSLLFAANTPIVGHAMRRLFSSYLLTGVLLSIMFATSLFQYSMLLVDWMKQSLVVEALKTGEDFSSFSTLVLVDKTQFLNWDNRGNPLYETTGWARAAYGEQGILAVETSLYESYVQRGILGDASLQEIYGFAGWDSSGGIQLIQITTASSRVDFLLGRGEVSVTPIDKD